MLGNICWSGVVMAGRCIYIFIYIYLFIYLYSYFYSLLETRNGRLSNPCCGPKKSKSEIQSRNICRQNMWIDLWLRLVPFFLVGCCGASLGSHIFLLCTFHTLKSLPDFSNPVIPDGGGNFRTLWDTGINRTRLSWLRLSHVNHINGFLLLK